MESKDLAEVDSKSLERKQCTTTRQEIYGPSSEIWEEHVIESENAKQINLSSSKINKIFSDDTISKLKHGILSLSLPDTQKSEAKVKEVIRSQDVVQESIQQELLQLEDFKVTGGGDDIHIGKVFADVKLYHGKLANIKKDMQAIQDKSDKMKRKVIRLQIQKQKEELHKAQQKERQLEKEREITAKPAAAYSKTK